MAQGSSDEELLRDLCNSNGLQYEQVISSGSKKTKMLEMFFFGIPRISGLHYFPNLRVFRAVNQNMQTIEGLEACPCLEELWLCECKIKKIQGLEKCTKLKKLFLYQNHIAKIEGLEKLHLLSVLWLNSNRIETIEGLSHLENLQDLNLAENKLERIGNGLDGLEHLHVLNLSANNISRFEDLAPMFDLPSLEEVSLADPMYEPNPVSKLCNYSTHLLYHLPCVKRLDGRDITHPYLSNIIKLVVFRKKQFYSMRETHLNLVSSAGCSRLRSRTATKLNPLHQRLRKIQLHLKTGTGGNEAALDGIRSRIAVLEEECKRLAAECEKRCREQELQAARTQHWLRVELQSGGNIKYCEGTESHPWMGPCRDIVSEMMDMEELKHLGIVSCTVSGVTKVDNRGCQLAVDKAVKSIMLSPGLPDGTKVADYITYFLLVWKEGMSLEAVMENGKFPKQEDGSVVLTSRVSHAIQHIIPRGDSTPTSVSAVLCQVFMRPLQGTHQSSSSPDTPAPSLQSPEAPSQSVIVNVPSELVLAEYIVNLQIAKVPASSQPSIKVPDNDLDVCTLVCPTLPEIEELNSEVLEPLLQQEDVKSTEELRLCGRGIRRTHPSFQPLMSAVRSLDLSHNRLTTTAHVENMPNLVSLGLSYNAISSLEGMKGLLKLQYIDLSWNSLNNLSEVASTLRKNTPNLLILDLRGNEWEECLEDTPLRLFLIGHLKLLQCLNGVRVKGEESEGALRAVVSSHLSMATIASKVRASPQVPQTLSLLPTADYLHEKSSMRPSQLTSEQSDWWKNITSVCGNKLSLVQIKAVGKCSNLKWASFSHNHLQQLDGLEECGELEELHADHNWLRKIDSACSLTHLVHLSLSHNLIPTLSPLGRSPLLNLKYLDISSNRLTSLSGVEECSALLELYAGNNKLKTARDILPVKRLPQVMILDLYGNPIHTEERMLRLYAAYHITTLKTFNGTPLESKEFTAAKEMYGGRLNAEFVQEKTGHSRFHELKQMDYPHCNLRIVELQPVNQFASLLSLNLEHNQLTSFNGLLQLPNLKVLCLNHNKIERLSTGEDAGGGVLPSLQVLHVAYNQLGSLVPLQLHRMPTLRALFLQGNQLVNLDGLIGLTKLTELVLDHNKIRNIGEHSFSSLTDLRVLHIEENRLRELRNFAWLVHLEKLFLGMNRIQEFADLDELCALSHVNELSLLSNPVSRRLHYRTQILCRLPHLTILDGVTVTEDEQMRVRAILHEQEPAESYGIVHTSSGPFVVTNMSTLPQDGVRNPLPHHHPPNSDSSYYRK